MKERWGGGGKETEDRSKGEIGMVDRGGRNRMEDRGREETEYKIEGEKEMVG